MKVLTTEQQTELQSLLTILIGFGPEIQVEINKWAKELKPKRIRRKAIVENNP